MDGCTLDERTDDVIYWVRLKIANFIIIDELFFPYRIKVPYNNSPAIAALSTWNKNNNFIVKIVMIIPQNLHHSYVGTPGVLPMLYNTNHQYNQHKKIIGYNTNN